MCPDFPYISEAELRKIIREELRLSSLIPLLPHVKTVAELKAYAAKIGSALNEWCVAYSIFGYGDTALALCGRLPSGLFDVERCEWRFIEDRIYYEPIGGVDMTLESGVVAWTSWNTPYMFLYDGSGVKMVNLGEVTGGNIVASGESFYAYRKDGTLVKVTPDGTVTTVSRNPNHQYGFCWMAKALGSKLFFPTTYPERSLFSYDLNTGSWAVEKAYGGTAHDPSWAYVNLATWDTLAYLGVMPGGMYRREFFLGFLYFVGTTSYKYDYGILPYSYSSSGDVWNMNPTPIMLSNMVTLHWINGILWAVGHPNATWGERPPNVQPLGAFPPVHSAYPWKGGLLFGYKSHFFRGISNTPPVRYGSLLYVRQDDLFRLKLPPAKATIWGGKSIAAGETSLPLVTEGWREVTVFFKSSAAGDLTVQVDPDGRADIDGWEDYVTRTATTREFLTIDEHFTRIRLKFSAAATVTAKANLIP